MSVQATGMDASALGTVVLIFVTGALSSYLLNYFRLPAFLGFILAGIVLGPSGLSLIKPEQMHVLSQVGIIFLLFIVGLELSVDKLKALRFRAPLAGVLQIVITTFVLTLSLKFLMGFPWQLASIIGAVLSLSSTAVVLKSLEEHGVADTVHGRVILGMLIIQDLAIIPLMAMLPFLLAPADLNHLLGNLSVIFAKTVFWGALSVFISLKAVPFVLDHFASTNQKELFTIALACVGLGMSLLTHQMGLSYEAGAFIAGLSLSRSLYCRQLIADSKGFRDVFITFFFVSMGLVFNTSVVIQFFPVVVITTVGVIALKAISAFVAVRLTSFQTKTALWTAISLFQVGEFSFVLLGKTLEAVSQVSSWHSHLVFWSPILIDSIIFSMFLTPLVIRLFYLRSCSVEGGGNTDSQERLSSDGHVGDVIIAGYGPVAKSLSGALQETGMSYCIVEVNLKTIRYLSGKHVPCLYGDISSADILKEVQIQNSKILAITFPDLQTAQLAIHQAKRLNPSLYCIARARFKTDVDQLYGQGADRVIYDEMESGISFVVSSLKQLNYPLLAIENMTQQLRSFNATDLKSDAALEGSPVFGRFNLFAGNKIEWVTIPDNSPVVGNTMKTLAIRQATGVNIIAVIESETQRQIQPDPDLVLDSAYVLVGIGTIEQLYALESLLLP